jgi:hypothetical protein
MQVYLSSEKPKTTVIEHFNNGALHHLEFSNNTLAKTSFVQAVNDENPIFTHLNRYLAKIPNSKQDEIFDIMAEIQSEIDNANTLEVTNTHLRILFTHLFQRISFDEILALVMTDREFMKDISLPSFENIKQKYESVGDNYTQEKTYIFTEYQELIALIIQLRIMFPIWAHYIEVFFSSLGTNYKEFEAFKLIEDSNVFKNKAMQKLVRYVQANTPNEGSKAAIIDFISSEDYAKFNLALVVVRKICTMEIRNPGEKHPILIMHISTHVREKITNNDKKQGAIIVDKIGQDQKATSEERQVSMYERFKIRDQLSTGQKVFLMENVINSLQFAKMLKPGIDLDLVNAVITKTIDMGTVPVENVQKIILRNIIANVIPSKVVDLMDREVLLRSLAVVAAVLITDGFPEIAQFCTASVIPSDGSAVIATDNHQNKVTTELRDSLTALMPFQRSGKSKTATSPIVENVDMIFKELINKVWHSNLPDYLIAPNGPIIRRIKIPGNLRIRLTQFAIYVVERPSSISNVEDKLTNLIY